MVIGNGIPDIVKLFKIAYFTQWYVTALWKQCTRKKSRHHSTVTSFTANTCCINHGFYPHKSCIRDVGMGEMMYGSNQTLLTKTSEKKNTKASIPWTIAGVTTTTLKADTNCLGAGQAILPLTTKGQKKSRSQVVPQSHSGSLSGMGPGSHPSHRQAKNIYIFVPISLNNLL